MKRQKTKLWTVPGFLAIAKFRTRPPPTHPSTCTHTNTHTLAETALCQSAPSESLCSRLAALLLLRQPELMEPEAEPKRLHWRRHCIGTRSSHKVKRQMQHESWLSRDPLVPLGFVSEMECPRSFRGRERKVHALPDVHACGSAFASAQTRRFHRNRTFSVCRLWC